MKDRVVQKVNIKKCGGCTYWPCLLLLYSTETNYTPYCELREHTGTTNTGVTLGPLRLQDRLSEQRLVHTTAPAAPALTGLWQDVLHLKPATCTTALPQLINGHKTFNVRLPREKDLYLKCNQYLWSHKRYIALHLNNCESETWLTQFFTRATGTKPTSITFSGIPPHFLCYTHWFQTMHLVYLVLVLHRIC